MNIISYAQNFEDVILWRALKHVDSGFYLDIGAQDPTVDSVSLAFYERGWRGCHVEPTMQYSTKLRQARPDELVLQLAIGKEEGLIDFFEFENTGLSTSSPEIADAHSKQGFECRRTTVPVISLQTLLQRLGDRDIHWMKVDVEGGEQAVIEGWKDSPVRPWILVIESTRPLSPEETHRGWEPLILDRGYEFAYFDALNRFYVHRDHLDLLPSFASPPNIFDGFELSGTASHPFYRHVGDKAQQAEVRASHAETRAHEQEERALAAESAAQAAETRADELQERALAAEARAQEQEERAQAAEAATHQSCQQADEWHERILALHNSTSWKITRPLRAFKRMAGADFSLFHRPAAAVGLKAKLTLRPLVAFGIQQVFQRPELRARLSRTLKKFPRLHRRLLRVAVDTGVVYGGIAMQQAVAAIQHVEVVSSEEFLAMSPRARRIYADLQAAIEIRKAERR